MGLTRGKEECGWPCMCACRWHVGNKCAAVLRCEAKGTLSGGDVPLMDAEEWMAGTHSSFV